MPIHTYKGLVTRRCPSIVTSLNTHLREKRSSAILTRAREYRVVFINTFMYGIVHIEEKEREGGGGGEGGEEEKEEEEEKNE